MTNYLYRYPKRIQEALVAHGYDPKMPIDGIVGPRTKKALADFKRAHGWWDRPHVGPLTWRALFGEAPPDDDRPAIVADAAEPKWLSIARGLVGIREYRGSANNDTILGWARSLGGWIKSYFKRDAIPWCALFANYVLQQAGEKGTGTLWALDFRKWGKSYAEPFLGAIATKTRNGGGHVFFVAGRTSSGRIVGIGGNQSDAVTYATFDESELAYNAPTGYVPNNRGLLTLPLLNNAGKPIGSMA